MTTLEEHNIETRRLVTEMQLLCLRRLAARQNLEISKLKLANAQARYGQLRKNFLSQASGQPSVS